MAEDGIIRFIWLADIRILLLQEAVHQAPIFMHFKTEHIVTAIIFQEIISDPVLLPIQVQTVSED